jgi:hypothetical protein
MDNHRGQQFIYEWAQFNDDCFTKEERIGHRLGDSTVVTIGPQ